MRGLYIIDLEGTKVDGCALVLEPKAVHHLSPKINNFPSKTE